MQSFPPSTAIKLYDHSLQISLLIVKTKYMKINITNIYI